MGQYRVIRFRHLDGSIKSIPGVTRLSDLSPKVDLVSKYEPELGKYRTVLQRDDTHVVTVPLLDESPEFTRTARFDELPEIIKGRIQETHADEYLNRIRINNKLRDRLNHYASRGKIEIVFDGDVDAAEVAVFKPVQISFSAIAIADHEDRNVPIPDYVNRLDDERPIAPVSSPTTEQTTPVEPEQVPVENQGDVQGGGPGKKKNESGAGGGPVGK